MRTSKKWFPIFDLQPVAVVDVTGYFKPARSCVTQKYDCLQPTTHQKMKHNHVLFAYAIRKALFHVKRNRFNLFMCSLGSIKYKLNVH